MGWNKAGTTDQDVLCRLREWETDIDLKTTAARHLHMPSPIIVPRLRRIEYCMADTNSSPSGPLTHM